MGRPSRVISLPICLLLLLLSASQTDAARVQHPALRQTALSAQRAQEVKDVFIDAYGDYKKYAWGHDEVAPLTNRSRDTRNGWGATIIDAMTTMIVMNLTDLFEEAVDFVSTVNFTQPNTDPPGTVSVFESIIRYVGSLLSSYELTDKQHPILLQQAERLSSKLAFAWSRYGKGNIPYTWLDFENDLPAVTGVGLATAGTNILEFSKLSKYTLNNTYLDLSLRSMRAVLATPQVWPGLFGEGYNPQSDTVINDKISFGPNSDSFYEYLIKYAHMTGNADPVYLDTWLAGVDSAIAHMLFKSTAGGWTYLSNYSNRTKQHEFTFGHLACYIGGNWLLGGRLANNATIVSYGLALVDACAHTYTVSPLGIGPEMWSYVPEGPLGNTTRYQPVKGSPGALAYERNGFWMTDKRYILRPEVMESVFYAYRITGDTKYQDIAYEAFSAIRKNCKAPASYASLVRMDTTVPVLRDESESFFYAELLKYFYLTFSDPNVIHLDKFTITTEAHPFYLDSPVFNYFGGMADMEFPDPPPPPPAPPSNPLPVSAPAAQLDGECAGQGGTVMSYLMMLMDFYVPVLERCNAQQ